MSVVNCSCMHEDIYRCTICGGVFNGYPDGWNCPVCWSKGSKYDIVETKTVNYFKALDNYYKLTLKPKYKYYLKQEKAKIKAKVGGFIHPEWEDNPVRFALYVLSLDDSENPNYSLFMLDKKKGLSPMNFQFAENRIEALKKVVGSDSHAHRVIEKATTIRKTLSQTQGLSYSVLRDPFVYSKCNCSMSDTEAIALLNSVPKHQASDVLSRFATARINRQIIPIIPCSLKDSPDLYELLETTITRFLPVVVSVVREFVREVKSLQGATARDLPITDHPAFRQFKISSHSRVKEEMEWGLQKENPDSVDEETMSYRLDQDPYYTIVLTNSGQRYLLGKHSLKDCIAIRSFVIALLRESLEFAVKQNINGMGVWMYDTIEGFVVSVRRSKYPVVDLDLLAKNETNLNDIYNSLPSGAIEFLDSKRSYKVVISEYNLIKGKNVNILLGYYTSKVAAVSVYVYTRDKLAYLKDIKNYNEYKDFFKFLSVAGCYAPDNKGAKSFSSGIRGLRKIRNYWAVSTYKSTDTGQTPDALTFFNTEDKHLAIIFYECGHLYHFFGIEIDYIHNWSPTLERAIYDLTKQ